MLVLKGRSDNSAFVKFDEAGSPPVKRAPDGTWSLGAIGAEELNEEFTPVRDPKEVTTLVNEASTALESLKPARARSRSQFTN